MLLLSLPPPLCDSLFLFFCRPLSLSLARSRVRMLSLPLQEEKKAEVKVKTERFEIVGMEGDQELQADEKEHSLRNGINTYAHLRICIIRSPVKLLWRKSPRSLQKGPTYSLRLGAHERLRHWPLLNMTTFTAFSILLALCFRI